MCHGASIYLNHLISWMLDKKYFIGPDACVLCEAIGIRFFISFSGCFAMLERAFTDYYAVLDVKPGASLANIKRAYREKALLCHPDMVGEAGAEVFMLIKLAYETLTGKGRRAYDMELMDRRKRPEGLRVQHDLRFVSARIRKRKWWEDPLKTNGVEVLMNLVGRRQ